MKQIVAVPATLALVYRAWSRKSLTTLGIIVATLTAAIHAIHPWSVFFALLVTFFLSGTAVTKVKHDVKTRLTASATGYPTGEGARTHIQVLANSLIASILILFHVQHMNDASSSKEELCSKIGSTRCGFVAYADPLIAGIIANYAAVSADTFSSELGILAKGSPRLITNLARIVPPGTNGGVTVYGTAAGLCGSCITSVIAVILLPDMYRRSAVIKAETTGTESLSPISRLNLFLFFTIVGFAGTIVDSLLGAVFQASVVDTRTGKVIEGEGGRNVIVHRDSALSIAIMTGEMKRTKVDNSAEQRKVPYPHDDELSGYARRESRRIENGQDVLDNNAVNLLMAGVVSVGAILIACLFWL